MGNEGLAIRHKLVNQIIDVINKQLNVWGADVQKLIEKILVDLAPSDNFVHGWSFLHQYSFELPISVGHTKVRKEHSMPFLDLGTYLGVGLNGELVRAIPLPDVLLPIVDLAKKENI